MNRNILLIIERNIIFPYSDKKIIANPPLPYSVLKPETNSDSPSAKSKGARFVSAISKHNQDKNHMGFINKRNQTLLTRLLKS